MHHTSKTLFVVSTVYLVLLLPLGIVETLELYWDVVLIKFPDTEIKKKTEYIYWYKFIININICTDIYI